MFFSELCLWHIWSMYWNFHVTKIIFSPENWILVIFWCNLKVRCKPQNFACNHGKPLHLTIQVCQMVLTFRKSFFDQIWQPQKLWLTIFQAMCFLDCQPQKLDENNFFSWFRKNVGEYSIHKNLRSNKQFFSEITRFCYKWHVSRWNIIFDYAQ